MTVIGYFQKYIINMRSGDALNMIPAIGFCNPMRDGVYIYKYFNIYFI